jgi:hypothetical protein
VVALDDRAELDRVGQVASLADVLVRFPYADPVERATGWLASLSHGDWIFSIDDDEVPSAALLDVLKAPDPALTHALVPRRWLWGEGWIDEDPWSPDWQLRLLRRDKVQFPGVIHIPVRATGPHAYLDAPLYHLDLVANARAQREAKAKRYEGVRRGIRLGGESLNAMYLPELRPHLDIAPVPREDAALVATVSSAPEPDPSTAPDVRLSTREEIDAHWPEASLAESDCRARVEIGPVPRVVTGEVRKVDVLATNLGEVTWPAGPEGLPEIRLAYRFEGSDSAGLRTPFPRPVAPGETVRVPLSFKAPSKPGRHTLVVDIVHERHRWFGCEASVEITVSPRRRALILIGQPPGDTEFDGRVDEALAALDPSLEPFLVGPKPEWLLDRFGVEAGEEPPSWAAAEVVSIPAGRRRDRLRMQLLARRLRRRARG